MGYDAYSTDINPFLIWFARSKTSTFSKNEISAASIKFERVYKEFRSYLSQTNWAPEIHNITRWWEDNTLRTLTSLRRCIVDECGEVDIAHGSDKLIWISFCRLVIETSSAAFNHVSMSFKEAAPNIPVQTITDLFKVIYDNVSQSATSKIVGKISILEDDARNKPNIENKSIDLVVTSPPYVNRISYIRELRPYMYWTKFIQEKKEAGEIDWKAIGGTWGTATSNLKKWEPKSDALPDMLLDICDKISKEENKHADTMARYVMKYFDDMFFHIKNIKEVLKPGAKLHYIIGNSNFYGNCVKADKIFENLFELHGFSQVESKIIRKRNSNKKLYEYETSCVLE